MKQIVIMPGGFHPFHAGHMALYNSAKEAFPDADVYVAATDSQEERPFPFAVKEKLAKVAGVDPGRFIQVKSPFKSNEITDHYDPEEDVLIFVRSEKDRNESPKPGGRKKDGSSSYFQPWTGKNVESFNKHAYMAYLPTVTFGPGIKSATEIRNAWPNLNDRQKTAMVMSLYPATQKNKKLAANVVAMLDQVMGGSNLISEGFIDWIKNKFRRNTEDSDSWFHNLPQEEQDALHAAYYRDRRDPAHKAGYERHQARINSRPAQEQPPHGSTENEIRMFLAGTKPAALINDAAMALWDKIIKSGKYIVKPLYFNGKLDGYVLGQPNEQDRTDKLQRLAQGARDAAEKGDMRAYQNRNYHRWIGKLLGYPKDKIEAFIANYFKDTPDYAKRDIHEAQLGQPMYGLTEAANAAQQAAIAINMKKHHKKPKVNEVGDQPYQAGQRWRNNGSGEYTKSTTLPDGRNLEIVVEYEKPYALVNFYVNSGQQKTGEGDAYKIFATVGKEVNDFVGKYKPDILAFTASMAEESRVKLYDRFAERMVKSLPNFSNYTNISYDEELYGDLLDFADARHDIQEQILYVFASPKYMKQLEAEGLTESIDYLEE